MSHKWTEADREFIIANNAAMKSKDMAAVIGVNEYALRKQIYVWRSNGYEIPQGKTKPVAHESIRMINGKPVAYIKCTDGKYRVKCRKRRSGGRPRSPKNEMQKPVNMPRNNEAAAQKRHKHAKQQEARFTTKVVDLSAMASVRVPELNNATIYYNPAKETAQQVKDRYLAQRQQQLHVR